MTRIEKIRFSARKALRSTTTVFVAFLLTFHSLATAGNTVPKTATQKSVRVVMDDNYPPYTFRESSGTLQGILVDQWALWEKKTGIHVRLDAMDWAKAQQHMEAGDYDVIDTISANEQRKTVYDFSAPYANIDVPLFFSRELSGIRGPRDLEGFVVGVKKGDISIESLKISGVSNFLLFDNYEAIVAAARDGKIKVFTIDKPPALYFLIKMGIQDQFRESKPLYSDELHRAVRKGNTALLADIQRGFNAISKSEYEAIDRRWYGSPLITKARLTILAIVAGVSGGIICLLLLWVWMLRRNVRQQTAELRNDIAKRVLAEEALRVSEEKLTKIFQMSPDAIDLVRTADRVSLGFNYAFTNLFGYTPEEFIGKPLLPLGLDLWVNAEDRDRLMTLLNEHGQVFGFETPHRRKNGSIFIADISSSSLEIDGQLCHLSITRDITERKALQGELEKSKDLLQQVLDTLPIPVYCKDLNERYSLCNRTFQKFMGHTENDLLGKTSFDISSPLLGEIYRQSDRFLMETGATLQYETMVEAASGLRQIVVTKNVMRNPNGEITGLVGACLDITERKQAEEALQVSDTRMSAISDAAQDAILLMDPNGYISYWNPAATRILGYTHAEAIGKNLHQLIVPTRYYAEHHAGFAGFQSSGQGVAVDATFALEACHKNGHEICVEVSISAFHFKGGWHSVGIIRDISERKQAEEALRISEEKFTKIFFLCPDLITINRLEDGVYLDANQNVTNILGYDREEVIGRSPLTGDLGIWVDKSERDRLMAKILAHGEAIGFETQFRRKDGTVFTALESCRRLEINGEACLLSVTRDITDRKHAEELINRRITALTQPMAGSAIAFEDLFNQKELQRIQDEFAVATGVASIITQPDGTPITRPSNFTHLCSEIIRKTEKGCSNCFKSDAAIGRYHPNGPIVQQCLSGGLWDAGASIIVGGHHVANWLIGQVRDETQTNEHMSAYACEIGVDETSFLTAFDAVPSMSHERFEQIANALSTLANQLATAAYQNIQQARFIAESKRAELEKTKLEAQLRQAQKMEDLGSLAGGVAHDMNNVLGAILGMASANIATQPQGSSAYQAFDTISQAAIRGGKMVKSLLNFARQSPIEEHELDLNVLLREEVNLLERTILAKIRLEVNLALELRPILGDASALTHAIMNLCVNAVDAMPESGTLTLRTRNVDNDWIEVLVEDTGTGMSKEVMDKAMDPFFTTKEVGKGTGLGLSMVYSTVMAHHGQIEIQSDPGKGTRVRMRFPTCQPMCHPTEPAAEPQEESPPGRLKVLLVDDDELIQSTLQAVLEILGHTVVTTSCGEEALAKLEAGFQPDAVILDMNMPGLGGTGTLPRLRALRPTVPVLLATGRADQDALNLVAAHPQVTLLSKPFSMKELQQYLGRFGG